MNVFPLGNLGKKVFISFDSPLKLGWDDSSVLLSAHTVSILGYGNNIFVSDLPLERLMLFTVLSMGLYYIRVLTFISEIYVIYSLVHFFRLDRNELGRF